MKEFLLEVPLRWGDMDAMAHLNNVMYFRLMEEARIQWFRQFGFATLPTGEAPILAHAACDFVRAMSYPGVALVRQTVTRVGRSSVEDETGARKEGRAGRDLRDRAHGDRLVRLCRGQVEPWPEAIRETIT